MGGDEHLTTAVGGSADTLATDADERHWRPRRRTAFAIAAVALLLPFGASLLVARLVAGALPRPEGAMVTVGWWAAVVAASSATLYLVDRVARRLLPLAAVYRLALVFPDRAPPRYRVALQTDSARRLAQRLRDGGDLGDTPAEAAESVLALITALSSHDRLSRGHSERVRAYADLIAVEMGLSASDRRKLQWSALLHDVGKVHVRTEVLNKTSAPTEREWKEIRNHPAAAGPMLEPLRPWLGEWVDAATQHHERMDGRGYPAGLTGPEISLSGRIVAVADAYDCMTSTRSYKKPFPAEQARYELTRNSGTQFDPAVVRALLQVSVGRLHWAAGPLSWLAQAPGLREGLGLASGAGGGVAGAVGAAAVVTASAFGAFLVPPQVATTPTTRADVVSLDGRRPDPTASTVPGSDPGDAIASDPGPGDGANGGGDDPSGTPTLDGPTTTTQPTPSTTTTVPVGTPPPPPPTNITTPPATTIPPNRPPVALDDERTVSILSLGHIDVPVLANDHDPDGSLDTASLRITSTPASGTATIVGGQIRFQGLLNTSTVRIGYEICDDRGACDAAVLSVSGQLLGGGLL